MLKCDSKNKNDLKHDGRNQKQSRNIKWESHSQSKAKWQRWTIETKSDDPSSKSNISRIGLLERKIRDNRGKKIIIKIN